MAVVVKFAGCRMHTACWNSWGKYEGLVGRGPVNCIGCSRYVCLQSVFILGFFWASVRGSM